MSRSTLDYFSNSSFAGPQGPLSFPLLLQMDREYCVALVHKQAPRLLLASSTHGNHEWMILYLYGTHSALMRATCAAKVSHVRFSVGCCDREFVNRENFC